MQAMSSAKTEIICASRSLRILPILKAGFLVDILYLVTNLTACGHEILAWAFGCRQVDQFIVMSERERTNLDSKLGREGKQPVTVMLHL